ncbi:GWxTD domain-containing protein [Acidobacteriota bacterium]
MKKKHEFILISVLFFSSFNFPIAYQKKPDVWQKWLDEVEIIMTKAEKYVFKTLSTEEDKRRFQESFWNMRDPKPETSQNEYRAEFYTRRNYAESHLNGANMDRGRIYILMGEPREREEFSGYEKIVDCELWNYRGKGRPGLPPFMNLIFFKQDNSRFYRLFYPGPHSALDILSPGYRMSTNGKYEAFNELRTSFPELAHATLSIIPEDGDPVFGRGVTSSGNVLSQIYTLPEKEVDKNYLKNFASIEGIVDVIYSTKEIRGNGSISISKNRGIKFLNYSVMPDAVNTIKVDENSNEANISLNLKIENLEGKIIYQKDRELDLKLDDAKKKLMLDERKVVFKDFAPVVDGEYNVNITFSNKTTEEFFVYTENIDINDKIPPIMVGYETKKLDSEDFVPFASDNYKMLSDPRAVFNKDDSLEGIIFSDQKPEIFLESLKNKDNSIEILNIQKQGNFFMFKQPLMDLEAINFYLIIKERNKEIYRNIISILPFHAEKPIDLERPEPSSSNFNYIFILAQQHLNKGDASEAIEYLQKLPHDLWNSTTLPVFARAYYLKKDYEKVIALLEKNVEKNYSVLSLLANSSLMLQKFKEAAEYYEMLRKYGDTAKLNKVLGEIYYSLGDDEKAQVYRERAKKLEKKIN